MKFRFIHLLVVSLLSNSTQSKTFMKDTELATISIQLFIFFRTIFEKED